MRHEIITKCTKLKKTGKRLRFAGNFKKKSEQLYSITKNHYVLEQMRPVKQGSHKILREEIVEKKKKYKDIRSQGLKLLSCFHGNLGNNKRKTPSIKFSTQRQDKQKLKEIQRAFDKILCRDIHTTR